MVCALMLVSWLDDIKANQSRWILSSSSIEVYHKSCAHRKTKTNRSHCIVKIWVCSRLRLCCLLMLIETYFYCFITDFVPHIKTHLTRLFFGQKFLFSKTISCLPLRKHHSTLRRYYWLVNFTAGVFIYSNFHLVLPRYPLQIPLFTVSKQLFPSKVASNFRTTTLQISLET